MISVTMAPCGDTKESTRTPGADPVVLILTAQGRTLWRKVSPIYEASVDKVFGALPGSRRQAFLDDLQLLHDGLLSEEGSLNSDDRWHSVFSQKRKAS